MSPSREKSSLSSAVCFTCRQRKVRCDRRKPECGFCLRSGLDCQYTSAPKAPGLRAGYVARLERRIDDLEREFRSFKKKVETKDPDLQSSEDGSPGESITQTADESQPQATDIHPAISYLEQPEVRRHSFINHNSPNTLGLDLSKESLTRYCTIWFDEYHSWFPILHQPTVLEACHDASDQQRANISMILKAIAVVITPTQQPPNGYSRSQQQSWVQALEDEVILGAFHKISLQALQALLILTIFEYGSGRLEDFYNLISLCKRISTQLGLRDLVALNCINYGISSVAPPRMLKVPSSAVEREEKIRAFWATDALDSASTVGVAWHLSVSRPEPAGNVPCDDEIWRFPESILAMYQFGNLEAPSSFSLFVRLATNELWAVHDFLQHVYDPTSVEELQRRQDDCDAVYQRLCDWHRDFEQMLTVHTPVYTDLFASSGATSQHPNSILIHCTIHSAVISLYQRFIFPVDGAEGDGLSWMRAAERCLSSCDQMATLLRGVSDAMLETTNPHVIYPIFIAARFYMMYSRAMGYTMPNKLFLLVYALRVCGQRWPLARQLHKVLEAAAAETAGTSAMQNPLPSEFYDLQYFSLDIHEALKGWAVEAEQTVAVAL